MAFIDVLPPDVSANVLMHIDMPGYETYDKICRYDVKLNKVTQNQRRKPRSGLNLVADFKGDSQGLEPADEEVEDEEFDIVAGIAEIMSLGLAPAEDNADI